jgi:spore coat polysaccharide biosynthesis predicted glycosyltransferase SpsG
MATVAVRVDGGGQAGHGHFYRCMALSAALRDLDVACIYYTRTRDILDRLAEDGPTMLRTRGSDRQWLAELAKQHHAVVVDLPDVSTLRPVRGVTILPRSHPWPGHPVPLDWDHVILRQEFSLRSRTKPKAGKVFVSAGGTDPGGLLPLLLSATNGLDVRVAAGGIVRMADYMSSCDVALVSYGVTALELAACRVPAVYVCLSEDHALGAAECEAAGFGVSLGLCRDTDTIRAAVVGLMEDEERKAIISSACCAVDGLGAQRVASEVYRSITEAI